MREPSKDWKEIVAPDEATRFEGYANLIREIQARNSQRLGNGRGLHRKGILGLDASFEVLDGLPAHARQGLFANPGTHAALVRLSNGSQGVPVVKPKPGAWASHGMGVRQPSRPLNSG